MEDSTELPSLPDLLDELDTDVDINSLEQLTQSLLQDIARDLEAAAQKTDCQVSILISFIDFCLMTSYFFGMNLSVIVCYRDALDTCIRN